MLLRRRDVALLAGLACMSAAFGMNFAAGALFPFLVAEHGWSAATLGAVAGLTTALTGFLQPLVGRAVDARSARRVLLTGMALLVAAQLLLSLTSQPWQFVPAYGVLGAAGFAASSTPPVGLSSFATLLAGIAAAPLLALVLLLRDRAADSDRGASTRPASTRTSDTPVPDPFTRLTTKGMS